MGRFMSLRKGDFTMFKKFAIGILAVMLVVFYVPATQAALPIDGVGPVNLANGFPLWWMDQGGRMIELCLPPECAAEGVQAGNAFSEQVGFGAEAFWWSAGATMAFPGGDGELVLAMEAAWFTETARDGEQLPFGRIRVRANVDTIGQFTIQHPFGTIVVDVAAIVGGPEINETIDVGGAVTEVPPFSGALATEITNFLRPVGLVDPNMIGSGIIEAGPNGNVFSITGPGTNATTDQFDVIGKIFIPNPNVAPTATPDLAGTTQNTPVIIDVVANDVDVIDLATNIHGINPLATGIGAALPFVTATPVTTANGGQVAKNNDGTFTYTPSATFVGSDTFSYAVQDTGGLPATAAVTITVETMTVDKAVLRAQTMKWRIEGTNSTVGTTITIYAGADLTGPVIGTAIVDANNNWVFEGKSTTSPGTTRRISVVSTGLVPLMNQPLSIR